MGQSNKAGLRHPRLSCDVARCACVCKHVTDELSLGNALGMWSGRFLHSASIYPRLPLNAALASPNAKPEGVYDSFGKKRKKKERVLVCCVLLCFATRQGQTF